jgi:hypothetical protein
MTIKKLFGGEKTNAKQEPKIYYCKHIAAGVCGYEKETILIGEECLKEMDKTFAGKPVYVDHQDVKLETLQHDADGYVVESFYLPEDGCHWAKFIVVSDSGHEAVAKGYRVSNAYIPDGDGAGGEWHNLPYGREIVSAHYTHLALVGNPRYEEAEIMTPEEFKQYKTEKREQLNQLQNSKNETKENKSMFKLFKKQEVKNSADLSEAMVELSNGKAISIAEMINAVETAEKEKSVLTNKVMVNGKAILVEELVNAYKKLAKKNEEEEKEEDEEDKDVLKSGDDEDKDKDKEDKENAEDDEEASEDEEDEEAENADDEKSEEDKKASKKSSPKKNVKPARSGVKNSKPNYYAQLMNAGTMENSKEAGIAVETQALKEARGAEKYGSAK